jgi:hypothetical protein
MSRLSMSCVMFTQPLLAAGSPARTLLLPLARRAFPRAGSSRPLRDQANSAAPALTITGGRPGAAAAAGKQAWTCGTTHPVHLIMWVALRQHSTAKGSSYTWRVSCALTHQMHKPLNMVLSDYASGGSSCCCGAFTAMTTPDHELTAPSVCTALPCLAAGGMQGPRRAVRRPCLPLLSPSPLIPPARGQLALHRCQRPAGSTSMEPRGHQTLAVPDGLHRYE